MSVKEPIKILYLVSNDLTHDPRLQKQLKGASKAGHEAIGLGFSVDLTSGLPPREKIDGYQIERIFYNLTKINLKVTSTSPTMMFFKLYKIIIRGTLRLARFIKRIFFPVTNKSTLIRQSSTSLSPPPKESSPGWLVSKINPFLNGWALIDYHLSLNILMAYRGTQILPQIVHANDLDTLWAGYLIKKRTGAKLLYDAHEFWLDMGVKAPKLFISAFKLSEKYLLRKIDAYVTVNQPILEKTESFYNHKFQVPAEVVYNCPNYEKVVFKKPDPRKIKILYQGRYALNRGLEQLTESARYLPKQAEISFRAIKDPEIENKLIEIVKLYGLGKQIKFLDAAPMTEMVKAAKFADIGVIPYVPVHIDNQLASPNKLFEYMMAGLALACSDLPVLRYFVKKYKNGVLFNPRDPKSIAKALNYLISHPEELIQMKENSLEAAKVMNWGKEQEKLVKIYEKILD